MISVVQTTPTSAQRALNTTGCFAMMAICGSVFSLYRPAAAAFGVAGDFLVALHVARHFRSEEFETFSGSGFGCVGTSRIGIPM